MFTEERQNAIEKCLREKGKVRVKELSEMFQVTEDCIRKDLKILENAGRLKRTYGGAILSQEYPLERNVVDRRMYNLDKKPGRRKPHPSVLPERSFRNVQQSVHRSYPGGFQPDGKVARSVPGAWKKSPDNPLKQVFPCGQRPPDLSG